MNILHPLRVWQLFLFLAVGDTLWAYFLNRFGTILEVTGGNVANAIKHANKIQTMKKQ
jgi:hypothetical protein